MAAARLAGARVARTQGLGGGSSEQQLDACRINAEPPMRPMFTVHAGEFLVGQYIEGKLKKNVWMPTKDVGVDLLVTNAANTRAVTLQVKFSRDFLPKAGTVRADAAKAVRLRSRTSCGRFGFSDRFGRLAPRVSTRREYPSLSCPPASAAVGTCLK